MVDCHWKGQACSSKFISAWAPGYAQHWSGFNSEEGIFVFLVFSVPLYNGFFPCFSCSVCVNAPIPIHWWSPADHLGTYTLLPVNRTIPTHRFHADVPIKRSLADAHTSLSRRHADTLIRRFPANIIGDARNRPSTQQGITFWHKTA